MNNIHINLFISCFLIIGGCHNKGGVINQNNNSQKNYTHKLKLQIEPFIVPCGNIAFAYAFKFKALENDSLIVGIIRCPDGYGKDFFKEDVMYEAEYTDKQISDSLKEFTVMNPYKKYYLPTYLISEIRKAK